MAAGWQGPVRVLFIDGDHEASAVAADVEAWLPHLSPGGFLLLHDSTGPAAFPGPAAVVSSRIHGHPEFDRFGALGSISWARRRGAPRPWVPPDWGRWTVEPLVMGLKGIKAARRRDPGGHDGV